ncbi:MAG: HPr family phosphocarrier protein [Parvularculaceae bacterium]
MNATEKKDEAVTADVVIVNKRGLHARASARFCAVAAAFDAKVTVTKDAVTVGGRSIMALLTLGASKGATIMIAATGPQAEEAVDTLVKLVADRFGEED